MSKEHEKAYNSERKERWELAKAGEKDAMAKIFQTLKRSFPNAKYSRYDIAWFSFVKPSSTEWVHGVSDYVVAFSKEEGIFAEIKLKQKMFRKTKFGGTTANGSLVPNYGCESAYLDERPVFSNVRTFLEMFSISKDSFFFFFVGAETNLTYAISIAEIETLLENGYNGTAIGTFGEGYGTKVGNGRAVCYLLPINAMHILGQNDKEYFENKTTPKIILPINYTKFVFRNEK